MTTETKPRTVEEMQSEAMAMALDLVTAVKVGALVREAFALGRASPEEGRLREALEAALVRLEVDEQERVRQCNNAGSATGHGYVEGHRCHGSARDLIRSTRAALRSPPAPTAAPEDEGARHAYSPCMCDFGVVEDDDTTCNCCGAKPGEPCHAPASSKEGGR